MNNKLDLFKNAQDLLDEPAVQDLIDYCEKIEDELVDLKFELKNNKAVILLDMIKEVVKGCQSIEKAQVEHERFGFPAPDYFAGIVELKKYIIDMCDNHRIWIH
jgi:hypothetical protein